MSRSIVPYGGRYKEPFCGGWWAGFWLGAHLFAAVAQRSILWPHYAGRNHMPIVIDQKDLDRLPITIDPEIVSGTPVFRGTRVPVDALISNLEAGLTLDEFLDNFPTVTREQALQVLEFSKTTLLKLRKTA